MFIPKTLAAAAAKLSKELSRFHGNVELRRDSDTGDPELRVTDGRSLVVAKWAEPMKTALADRVQEGAQIDLAETIGFHGRLNGEELAKAAKVVKSTKAQERVQPVAGMLCLQEKNVADRKGDDDKATAFDVASHNGEISASCRVTGDEIFPNTEPILREQEKPEAVFVLSVSQLEKTLAVMKSAVDAPADKLQVTFGAVSHKQAVQLHVSAEDNTTGESFGLIMPLASDDNRDPVSPLVRFGKFAEVADAAAETAEPAEVADAAAETAEPGWKVSPAACFV